MSSSPASATELKTQTDVEVPWPGSDDIEVHSYYASGESDVGEIEVSFCHAVINFTESYRYYNLLSLVY